MNCMVKNIGLSITPIQATIKPSDKNITISHHFVKIGIPIILLLPKIIFKSHVNTHIYCRINTY